MPTFRKDPDEALDYTLDWGTKWLPAGDSVTDATWTVPTGVTEPKASTLADNKATVWVAGGTAGESYPLLCTITTAQGRIANQKVLLTIRPDVQ